jgi:ABC-type glycerol-3-phosphate transport system substrate-binding protein
MKLITEKLKSKLIEERDNYEWDKYSKFMINELIELCNQLKGQELRNIEDAFRTGWQTTDRWSLNLEIYDHIKSRYNEDTMTFDEYLEEKKSAEFWKKNYQEECNDQELLPCNCGKADRCNCHIAEGGNNG